MTAKPTNREANRLEALKQYGILDTPSESEYNDIATVAAFICDVPIALISFVDSERQWFKSTVGLNIAQTPRDISFCAHTILGKNMMVIKDVMLDRRFVNNPLVTCAPGIRFYAGVPLVTPSGYSIGTLCVIDRKPRADLSESQKKTLAALARQVVTQLELRRVSAQLADALEKIEIVQGLVPICSYCKGIRNDRGYWSTVEKFIQQYSDIEFTHGVCDRCMRMHFPEVAEVLLDQTDTDNKST